MRHILFYTSFILLGLSAYPAIAMPTNPAIAQTKQTSKPDNRAENPFMIPIGTDEKTHQSGYLSIDPENSSERSARAASAFAEQYGMYTGPEALASFTISIQEQNKPNEKPDTIRFSTTETIGGLTAQKPAQVYLFHSTPYIGSLREDVSTVIVPMTETTGNAESAYVFGSADHPMLAVSLQQLNTTMTPFFVKTGKYIDLPTRTAFYRQFVLPFDPKSKNATTSFSENGKTYSITLTQAELTPMHQKL
ncbi:hypothetical protein [Acetobacter pasteurianus]|uniref:hypothetical protein n=1 Tax=Acetobacter pasteurianus TaxID=438 RepID=UPI001362698A|nr:hypothetical protein [Acetobacter pasteurianus]QHM90374.1 hypothetical protein FCN51_01925 [Acetobacter pasteurianus]